MPPRRRRSLLILSLCAGAAQTSLAQDLCLPTDPPIAPLPEPAVTGDEAVEITAGHVEVQTGSGAQFSNQVEITFGDARITAEQATIDERSRSIEALGRVTYTDPEVSVYGDDIQVDTEAETIRFAGAGFDLPTRAARGSAEEILIESDSTLSLTSVLFTTCPAGDNGWEITARDIVIDPNTGLGRARGMKLDFKGVPIFYAPYFTFPIDDQRKSGFLTPDISERDRTGFDLSVPYYLNLAPNYDLTLEPRYMSKRGTQLRSEFRFLFPRSEGQLDFEYLPNDDEVNFTRRYVNLQQETELGAAWQVKTGLEEVSDDAYFEDLGSSLAVTSQTHLNRYLDLSYQAPYWTFLSRFQNYQTIDPLLTDEQTPYERVPQLLFDGRWFGEVLGFDSTTELVNFDRNVGVTGWRFDSTQEFSVRFARAGMYLTPAVAFRNTHYWLDDTLPGEDDTPSRSLPIASIDTGLKLERDAGRGQAWIQTLEPRLLYVHVPYEDQSSLPVFDTILPDFNLVQLFRKYQYVGPDRITDTDQWSFGITTRLIDSATGRERLTATLGKTRYLNAQRVSLPGSAPNADNDSDYVAEVSIGLHDGWNLDVGYQWNNDTDSSTRAETRFEYRPKADRLFGLGYRYRRGSLEQGDLSIVWPAADRWRIIGRYSYSFLEEEPLEQFVGWEYEACCWRFRMVTRRYVSRRTGEVDSAISIQLELKGLAQAATSPEELLDRGILGYRSLPRGTSQPTQIN